MLKVVVAGDCVWDYNVIAKPVRRYSPVPPMELTERAAGAWRLAELVKIACRSLKPSVISPPQGKPTGKPTVLKWSLYEKKRGEKDRVWRSELTGRHAKLNREEAVANRTPEPDLVVLEDLNLGFRDDRRAWPTALGDAEKILLRASSPLGSGALWDRLMGKLADRLTVLVSAESLRLRGAEIEPSISWDLALEQTIQEMKAGPSAGDLGCCERVIVHFRTEGAAVFLKGRFERLVYDPEALEGGWEAQRPGRIYDSVPLLTAAAARHILQPKTDPIFICLGRALAAMREIHEEGGGAGKTPDHKTVDKGARRILHPAKNAPEPADAYFTAFLPDQLDDDPPQREVPRLNLLRDYTGTGSEFMLAKASDVALRGEKRALIPVPKGRFGTYLTVDRDEIALLNAIRKVIEAYRESKGDRRPRSFAVFGPPGSGKSTAIKNLAKEVFGPEPSILEFNLSQFESTRDLHEAFHKIRDESIYGRIPLVLWDEFDTGDLKWLQHFLAPMQDAEFRAGGQAHPFEKCVFVFAGGTCHTFEEFDKSAKKDRPFQAVKGPDFVSRLHGYVNIKGPNPMDADDSAYLIRRALTLRFALEKYHGRLIDKTTGVASVSRAVIQAFLLVEKFQHGARSLETVVATSPVGNAPVFAAAHLPHGDLLRLHVSPDFKRHVRECDVTEHAIEALAEAAHKAWFQMKKEQGFTYGSKRIGKRHPLLVSYLKLDERAKEDNRLTARLTPAKLARLGYRITRKSEDDTEEPEFTLAERKQLWEVEHEIWRRDHLSKGWEQAEKTEDALRLHKDAGPFRDIASKEQKLDAAIVASILPALWKKGYTIRRAPVKLQ